MSFLNLESKRFLAFGVANRKSVAYQVVSMLLSEGAIVDLVVQNDLIAERVRLLFPDLSIFSCDVSEESSVDVLLCGLREHLANSGVSGVSACYSGLVHSLAFADYSDGVKPFYETPKSAFLQAIDISCFSLILLSGKLRELLLPDASVVTISISTTRMASENYGYMAPVKAALDSSLAFLAKSFSDFSEIRFNAVAPGLLKTSASAGIPGYADSYLYAEQVIPRKRALLTEEVGSTVLFLLSPRSSGINAQKIIIDAGMEINYFDKNIIKKVNKND
ncbi:MAG: SDR family oxidoreductase [Planctomycetaceae bacterium]|jgi:enoyl-[acyl-carrier protein] reductase I|nr:SDR family oxidoreductase [Planctomycetaceae bacterium]